VLPYVGPKQDREDGTKRKLDIHSSNLASTLVFLSEDVDSFAYACQLDPRCFGGSQSRQRRVVVMGFAEWQLAGEKL